MRGRGRGAWPGNVREIRNEVERMRLMNSDRLDYGIGLLDERIRSAVRKTGGRFPAEGPERPEAPPAAPPVPVGPGAGTGGSATREETAGPLSEVERRLHEGRSALRRRERLRTLFRRHRALTRAEILRILAVSPQTGTRDLAALVSEEFVRRVEPNGSPRTHYFVLREADGGKAGEGASENT